MKAFLEGIPKCELHLHWSSRTNHRSLCLRLQVLAMSERIQDAPASAAVETDTGVVSIPWTVSSANDSGAGTLREALESAPAGKVIDFDPDVFSPAAPVTITLASQLTINKNLTINGNGIFLSLLSSIVI